MKLSETQQAVLAHVHQHGEVPGVIHGKTVRSSTVSALQRRGLLRGDALTEHGEEAARSLAGESIAYKRPNRLAFRFHDEYGHTITFDAGQPDYAFWDAARRGQLTGMQLAGLFLRRIAEIETGYALGQRPTVQFPENEDAQEEVNRVMQKIHADVMLAMEESISLGDYYLVINPDLSATIVPPHVVKPLVADDDWSQVIGWRITQTFEHPLLGAGYTQTIIDDWTINGRKRTIKQNGVVTRSEEFRMLLPVVPVIHIPNDPDGNSMFGRPAGEPMLHALQVYDQIFDAARVGNLNQGRPIAVFEKMGDETAVDKFIDLHSEVVTTTNPVTGEKETTAVLEITPDDIPVLGGTGEFNYKSPAPFTSDTMNLLGILFLLILQHRGIPEFIWGGAIASSKASAETQMPPFIRKIERLQGLAEKWYSSIVRIVIAYLSLTMPAQIAEEEEFRLKWAPLGEADGKLTMDAVFMALGHHLITAETAVMLLTFLDIDDPAEEVRKAKAQAEEERRARDSADYQSFVDDALPDDAPDEPERQQEMAIRKMIGEQHTGVMIAFEIPLGVAARLATAARQAGIEPTAPEDMHITLAYLGDKDEVGEGARERVAAALDAISGKYGGIMGQVGGIGRFNGSENSGDMDVIYASYDAPWLPKFRQELVEALDSPETEVKMDHGFTPHITLAYVEKGSAMPPLVIETMPLNFDAVTLYWGDERTRYEFNREMEMVVV